MPANGPRNVAHPEATHHGREAITPDHGRDDPYRPEESLLEHTFCPDCGAIFERGRWI